MWSHSSFSRLASLQTEQLARPSIYPIFGTQEPGSSFLQYRKTSAIYFLGLVVISRRSCSTHLHRRSFNLSFLLDSAASAPGKSVLELGLLESSATNSGACSLQALAGAFCCFSDTRLAVI